MRASSQQLSIPFSQSLYLAREKLVNKEAADGCEAVTVLGGGGARK